MRKSISFAALGLATIASAQNPTPLGLEILAGRVTSVPPTHGITQVMRLNGTPAAPFPSFEALTIYDAKYWQGIGDLRNTTRGRNNASQCEIDTFNIWYQDQNVATAEALDIVARRENAPGSKIAHQTQTLWTQRIPARPAGAPGGGALQTTIQVMTSANPPVASAVPVPCRDTFLFGIRLPPLPRNATWPMGASPDGLSVPFLPYVGNTPTSGDWPKGGNSAPRLYYLNFPTGGGGWFQNPATPMIFPYNLIPDTPVLQFGANHKPQSAPHGADHGYGAAGVWPEVIPTTARGKLSTDGAVIRFTDENVRVLPGVWTLFVSLTTAKAMNLPIFNFPGISGGLYLGIPSFFVTSGVTKGIDTEFVLARPGTLPVNLVGNTVYLQGTLTAPNKQPALTNMAGMEFR